MNKEQAKILIEKFNNGTLSASENDLLESYIERGWVEMSELESLDSLQEQLVFQGTIIPTNDLRKDFYNNLEKEKIINTSSGTQKWWHALFPKNQNINWGFGIATLLAGVLLGVLLQPSPTNDIEQVAQKLKETQEMMMLTLIEKESTSDRLKAVSISQEMNDVSASVTNALFRTLNNDENVNVRLAAINTLSLYAQKASVRAALIESIQHQTSPIVQLELAELMVQLQEKTAVDALQNLIDQKETPTEIKDQLGKKIKVLL